MKGDRQLEQPPATTTSSSSLPPPGDDRLVPAPAGGLRVPQLPVGVDPLTAALEYAAAGWYVVPLRVDGDPRDRKNPGAVLGAGWQRLSSRDPQQIVAWFAGVNRGVALHVGRSGAVVFDVDHPDRVPPVLARHLPAAPHQASDPHQRGRGHYLFLQPPGRPVGNSTGRLGGGWGDVRGRNGVIVVAPTPHAREAEGACYRWVRWGVVPPLPAELADLLPAAAGEVGAATDGEVAEFLNRHTAGSDPQLLDRLLSQHQRRLLGGRGRHQTLVELAVAVMKEAAAGCYPARLAAERLRELHVAARSRPHPANPSSEVWPVWRAESEWRGVLAWAVSAAAASDPAETRRRLERVVTHPTGGEGDTDGGGRRSAATLLVELARERYRLGVSVDGEPFAVPVAGPRVARLLRGGRDSLRAELAAAYLEVTGRAAGQQALADSLLVLEGLARQADPTPLHLRVAEHAGRLYVDLGDPTGRVVEVDPTGWRVLDTSPALFHRTNLTGPLPTPTPGGDVSGLWRVVNVDEEHRPVLLGVLVAAFHPTIPHPVLAFVGEQGAGKSSATRAVVELLDPSPALVRKPPRDADGWVTAAAGSWVVALDNLSTIPPWLADSLCRACTGDGDIRRRLYTDGDLAVFAFRRQVILNGIDLGALPDDLADRLVTIPLRRLPDGARRNEAELAREWQAAKPVVFGGLLDLLRASMAVSPSVRLDNPPRMVDLAHQLAAVDRVLGTDGLAVYRRQAGELAADVLESDPVLAALTTRVREPWVGTSGELLRLLEPSEDGWRRPKGWPADARALTTLLRRHAPSLRRLGWGVEELGRGGREKALRFSLTPPEWREGVTDARNARDARDGAVDLRKHPPQDAGDDAGNTGGAAGLPAALPAPNQPDNPPLTSANTEGAGDAGDAGNESPFSLRTGRVAPAAVTDDLLDQLADDTPRWSA